MTKENKLDKKISSGDFIVTAEFLPEASIESIDDNIINSFDKNITAVNVSDNPFGTVMSSVAGSFALANKGIEPICQIVTRDRNRIAIMSDLMGSASLGIKNVLCLSGYHQTLAACPESSNVYDIDSIQLINMVNKMNETGQLDNGTQIKGGFSMLVGAVANPFLKPLDLNIIRTAKKIDAGAKFIQTQAVFNVNEFKKWIEALNADGLTDQTAILAGILPLESVDEALHLCNKYTEFSIPDTIIDRMKSAGDVTFQKKEGIKICNEIITDIKKIKGIRGIHILSGGKERIVQDIIKG